MKKLLICCLLLISGLSHADDDTPNHYAYTAMLETTDERSMYSSIDIPKQIYLQTLSSQLNDLRVFNPKGQPVPFTLVKMSEVTETNLTLPVTIYPLDQQQNTNQDNNQNQSSIEQYNVNINSKDIQINLGERNNKNDSTVNYLLRTPDDIKSEHTIVRLTIDFDDTSVSNWQATAKLRYSDDLKHWQTAVTNIPLMSLTSQNNNQALKMHTIDLPAQNRFQARYWIITLTSEQHQLPTIKKIEFTSKEKSVKNVLFPLDFTLKESNHQEAIYQLPSAQPIKEISIELPNSGTVLPISIYYKTTDSDNDKVEVWHKLNDYIIRRYHDQDEPQRINLYDGRLKSIKQLKIKTINASFEQAPNIIGYRNSLRVIFNSANSRSFILAWGSAKATAVALPVSALLPESLSAATIPKANISSTINQSDITALNQADTNSTFHINNILIWLFLIAGAVFLIILALKLLNEIKKAPQ